ncbi:MAG: type III-A CRISPR-associated RAMP protein Csm4 [[Clostridium] aminophilum]|uniref:type III-A CRISPR-associated RAMP protein Csm4 n=1 Tax=[Clostridium] aminophilum TaxID=1526 RepID=UPI0026EF5A2C|nr:type III-A CRISPR-associated RAMP protein Csm4 [[Clostridium] aminophilum]MDD6196593.1 type III-A CRISPR-associated RAMP protein Csm4 [[Clostridium] aminophilum]
MEYEIFKLRFPYGVHFGDKSLEKSNVTFSADTLFSALCIEALKSAHLFDEFFEYVKNGQLLMSDGFPFVSNEFFLPKPMLQFHADDDGSSVKKKQFKRIKYVAMSMWDDFIRGNLDPEKELNLEKKIGHHESNTHVAIRGLEEAMPYRVGSYRFSDKAGLYILFGYEKKEIRDLFYKLLDRLSFSGLGGKRSAGLGRFEIFFGKIPEDIRTLLERKTDRYVSLSIGLPMDAELDSCIENASYILEKRSGFVDSADYSDQYMRKRDLYMFAAGSVFSKKFCGDVFDVSSGGKHPVYKYGKPVFIGV